MQNPETGELVDLSTLTERLHECFADEPPAEYVPGKTLLRDAVVTVLGWPVTEAEVLVDRLEAERYVRFVRDDPHLPGGVWAFDPRPLRGEAPDWARP